MSEEEQTRRILELEQLANSLAFSLFQKEAKFTVLNLMVVLLLKELTENGTIDALKLESSFSGLARPFANSELEIQIRTFIQRFGSPEATTYKYSKVELQALPGVLNHLIDGLLKPLVRRS